MSLRRRPLNETRHRSWRGHLRRSEPAKSWVNKQGRFREGVQLPPVTEPVVGDWSTPAPAPRARPILDVPPRCDFTETVVGEAIATATVKLEDSPEHLGDRTGLDASIRYETASGGRGILAIETKLTEQFSAKHYGLDHRPDYATYCSSAGNPFDQDRLEELTDTRWNQLWRNQMLAESVRVEEELDDAIQVVVYPERATDTAKLVAGYRDLLARPDAVIDLTIEALLDRLQPHVAPADTSGLADVRTRYVDLHLSRPLYEAFRAGDQPFERGPE